MLIPVWYDGGMYSTGCCLAVSQVMSIYGSW